MKEKIMGFFDDYDVDLDNFEASSGFVNAPDGTYAFEVANAETRVGTNADPDAVNITVVFALENEEGETYKHTNWYAVPKDPAHPSQRETISMGEFKALLLSAGVPETELKSAGPEDIIGLEGTLRLVTSRSKKNGKDYQNTRDIAFDNDSVTEDGESDAAPEAAPEAAPKARAAKAAPAAKSNPFAK